jgi:hypothetical protein
MLTVNRLTILLFAMTSLAAASGQSVWTALRNGDTATLKQLMDSGADPNMRDDIGATPLMYAAGYGSLTDLSVLLDHGALVNDATKIGSTAIMWAAGDAAKLDILLSAAQTPIRKPRQALRSWLRPRSEETTMGSAC